MGTNLSSVLSTDTVSHRTFKSFFLSPFKKHRNLQLSIYTHLLQKTKNPRKQNKNKKTPKNKTKKTPKQSQGKYGRRPFTPSRCREEKSAKSRCTEGKDFSLLQKLSVPKQPGGWRGPVRRAGCAEAALKIRAAAATRKAASAPGTSPAIPQAPFPFWRSSPAVLSPWCL